MPKSIHRREYTVLLESLRELRRKAQLTQVELSTRIGRPQSTISNIESGSRRLDVIELRDICTTLGRTLPDFIADFEAALRRERSATKTSRQDKA